MPKDFNFVDPEVKVAAPIAFTDAQKSDDARHSNNWYNVGKLKPGASIQQETQVDAFNAYIFNAFCNGSPEIYGGFYELSNACRTCSSAV